jgi:hypothetical protein
MMPMDFLNILRGCLLYFAIVRGTENVREVLKYFVIVMWVNLGVFAIQKCGFDPVYMATEVNKFVLGHIDACGLMGRNYNLAFFLAFVLPISMMFRKWIALFIIPVVFLLGSWAAGLAMIVGMLIYMFNSKIKAIPIGIIFAGIGGLIPFARMLYLKVMLRVDIWGLAIKEIFVNPFIGYGFGAFTMYQDAMRGIAGHISFVSSFNEYIRLFYTFGIVILSGLIFSCFSYYRKLYLNARKDIVSIALLSSVCALMVIPMFHEIFRFIRVSGLMIVMLGLFEVNLLDQKEVRHDSHKV